MSAPAREDHLNTAALLCHGNSQPRWDEPVHLALCCWGETEISAQTQTLAWESPEAINRAAALSVCSACFVVPHNSHWPESLSFSLVRWLLRDFSIIQRVWLDEAPWLTLIWVHLYTMFLCLLFLLRILIHFCLFIPVSGLLVPSPPPRPRAMLRYNSQVKGLVASLQWVSLQDGSLEQNFNVMILA